MTAAVPVPEEEPKDEPLTGETLALYEHFRHLDCGSVVDPVDVEDCAGMADEVLRFLTARGWREPARVAELEAELAKTISNFEEFAETVAERNDRAVMYRVGRRVGRTIYRQNGVEASDADELIGVMDTPELARLAAAAMSGEGCGHDLEAFDRQARELAELRSRVADYENRINWDTTCENCAAGLDATYEQTMRAERAEAERDRLADTLRAVQPVLDAAKEWREGYAENDVDQIYSAEDRLTAAVDAPGDVGTTRRVLIDPEDLRTVLRQRVRHCHERQGVWDPENTPDLANQPCVECAARAQLESALVGTTHGFGAADEVSPSPKPAPKDLWNLVGEPKRGFCCQDAYASAQRADAILHTGGCPNRCSVSVPIPNAAERGCPDAYPCALTAAHSGDHWPHPEYRLPAELLGDTQPGTEERDCVDCARQIFHDRHRTAAEQAEDIRELESALDAARQHPVEISKREAEFPGDTQPERPRLITGSGELRDPHATNHQPDHRRRAGYPMTQPDPLVEQAARRFHEAYERLAPDHGYETRKASAVPWEDVPERNRTLMLATVAEVLSWLSEQGRLIPEGAEIGEEWTMRYRVNGGELELAEDGGHVFDSRDEAIRHIEAWREYFPRLTYSDVEYLHRQSISTPWVAVPEEET